MAEILTESFCERCGTRYTFESAAPKARLKGLKVMSRGLRNFVLSDDTSMDEAMAAARNETDREHTSHQLDAFHNTFNFCMSCRQYTCGNCWNDAEGRCLSCAPGLGQEVVPTPFGNVAAGGAMTVTGAEAVGLHDRDGQQLTAAPSEPLAWPTSDLMREAEAGQQDIVLEPEVAPEPEIVSPASLDVAGAEPAVEAAPLVDAPSADEAFAEPSVPEEEAFDFAARFAAVAGPVAEAEPTIAEAPVAEPVVGAIADPSVDPAPERVAPVVAPVVQPAVESEIAAAPEPTVGEPQLVEPAAPTLDDRAAAAAANTAGLFQRFRPGESLDDEIEAYERAHAAEAAAVAGVVAEPSAPGTPALDLPGPTAPVSATPEPVYPEPEPAAVETFEPEPVFAAESEPVAVEPAPTAVEPERVFAPEPEPVAAEAAFPVEAEPVPAAEPPADYVPQPTWQIVAPDAPTNGVPEPPVQQPTQPSADASAASAEPRWPTTPQWPERDTSAGVPFLGRPAAASGGIDALWAASAQQVASVSPVPQAGPTGPKPGGVQPCVSCGLSLSANARFCRRCGTRQG
jgi:hypothetical protein